MAKILNASRVYERSCLYDTMVYDNDIRWSEHRTYILDPASRVTDDKEMAVELELS